MTDVQSALDNAIEAYFADVAKNSFPEFQTSYSQNFPVNSSISSIQGNVKTTISSAIGDSAVLRSVPRSHSGIYTKGISTGSYFVKKNGKTVLDSTVRIPINPGSHPGSWQGVYSDTIRDMTDLANYLILSMTGDGFNFKEMQKFIKAELERVNLPIDYDLKHFRHDTLFKKLSTSDNKSFALVSQSKSTYLPLDEKLEMHYSNASLAILKRGLTDLIISLLITVCVIGSLLYLYRVIYQQKQLAEVKNDLINNITHEFKTPIATITSAIEGIEHFNAAKDPQKTNKYLSISNHQLTKLNHMVEKLLETATLDSDRLLLTLEEVDIRGMLEGLKDKYQLIAADKHISLETDFVSKVIQADLFHLENAISNLIDNAVKYGGDNIDILLKEVKGKVKIVVRDDGHNIEKNQSERIFEKFYRIPTGNRHDVKGFGIGLYYTKKIIEKHGGSILLNLDANKTSFEVSI